MQIIDAYCLGFKEGPKGSETPYYLSRRNSNHSDYSLSSQSNQDTGFPMDIIWGESLTASATDEEETPVTKKKNKKKKKKNSS